MPAELVAEEHNDEKNMTKCNHHQGEKSKL